VSAPTKIEGAIMWKRTAVLVIVLCLLLFSPSYAAVAIYQNDVYKGEATSIDMAAGVGDPAWVEQGGRANFPLSANLVAAGYYNGVVSVMTSDLSNVPVLYRFVTKYISTTASEAGTLVDGIAGQLLTISVATADPGGSWNVTPDTATGWYEAQFDAAGDNLALQFIDSTYGWVVIGETGVTVLKTADY